MPMEKPTPAALDAFETAFPTDPRAERKSMFGLPAAFVNGHMFYGVFANGVILRLSDDGLRAACAAEGVAHFEPAPGRPWKEYVSADATRWGRSAQLAAWAHEALEHTAALPPKVAKEKKTRKARAPTRRSA